ncbi:MAG: DUF4388 domain-containing protein [Verrucomicrobiota bacterium]
MQVLIVHHDPEVSEPLVQLVKDYTTHDCALVADEAAALAWAGTQDDCRVLLTELEAPGIDGLKLGGLLGEIFPGLQTLFLPAYPASARRIAITKTKVFPEPIDGERLLAALKTAAVAPAGAPDLFQAIDVLQMCCLGSRSGAVQIVKHPQSGVVFLRQGRIVHAESEMMHGADALRKIAGWEGIEFAYDAAMKATETITAPWDEAVASSSAEGNKERDGRKLNWDEPHTPFAEPAKSKKHGFFGTFRKS